MGKKRYSNVGQIFLLPPKGQISPALLDGVQIPKGAFGHPVLIVHEWHNTVTMLVVRKAFDLSRFALSTNRS